MMVDTRGTQRRALCLDDRDRPAHGPCVEGQPRRQARGAPVSSRPVGGATPITVGRAPASSEPLTRREPVPPIPCLALFCLSPTIQRSFSGKLVGQFRKIVIALRGARGRGCITRIFLSPVLVLAPCLAHSAADSTLVVTPVTAGHRERQPPPRGNPSGATAPAGRGGTLAIHPAGEGGSLLVHVASVDAREPHRPQIRWG